MKINISYSNRFEKLFYEISPIMKLDPYLFNEFWIFCFLMKDKHIFTKEYKPPYENKYS